MPDEETSLDQYLKEVGKYEPISREEEIELGRRARRADRTAIEKLCQANLRFVISIAKHYRARGVSFDDLIQAGNVGLCTAAAKFDPDRGVKFISYAVWWIRQAIQSALAHHGRSVRVPLNRAGELSKILKMRSDMKSLTGRDPTAHELAAALNMDPGMVETLEWLNAGEVRLDAPIGERDTGVLRERLMMEEGSPAAVVEHGLMREEIQGALKTLRERDALVLRLYYGLEDEREHTLDEIGRRLGVTRERVRQLRDRGLKELRKGERGAVLASLIP